jgi:hypothetical protein
MRNEDETTSARSSIILTVMVFVVAGYCLLYGLQTLAWLEAKHWVSVNPWFLEVPQPLPAAAEPAKGVLVKAFDYSFTAPWQAEPKRTPSLTGVQLQFESGPVIVFYDPESQLDTLRTLKNLNPLEYQKLSSIFSDHPMDSNYSLYQAVYSASPAQLSPVMAGRDAMRMNVLLLWKLSFGFDLPGEIFSFDFGKYRGFQFGDPASGQPVAVRVFDDRDRQFRFIFTVRAGSDAKLTQDDISTVVSSLKPVPILER